MNTILFWDIDDTLLTTARAGIFAWEAAAEDVCGVKADLSSLGTSGLTDAEIAVLVVESCQLEASPDRAAATLHSYERHLPAALHRRRGKVLPGVVEILEDLADRDRVSSWLLTGNTRRGAQTKLSHYGLNSYFAAGAFCRERSDRVAIAHEARAMARRTNGNDGQDVFVIGDTPLDVRCGQAIGARTVAVASGTYTAEELAACDPWLVLEVLPPPPEFERLLGLVGLGTSRHRTGT